MPLLATTEPGDLPAWVQTIVQVGVAGAVLWYVGNRLLPRLMDANRDQLTAFREEMKAERDLHSQQVTRTHDRLDNLTTEVRRLADARTA